MAARNESQTQPNDGTRPLSGRNLLVYHWLPVALWLTVISLFSGSGFGGGNTQGLLRDLLDLLGAELTVSQFLALHFYLRKSAHVVCYGALGWLLFRAVRAQQGTLDGWRMRWAGAAVSGTLIVAALDELHQAYTPGRSGEVTDVLLDTAAAVLTLAALYAASRTRSPR